MTVLAVSTPPDAGWRWRIVNYAGEVVEESQSTFPTIATALTEGGRRLAEMDLADRSTRTNPYRHTTSYLRERSR